MILFHNTVKRTSLYRHLLNPDISLLWTVFFIIILLFLGEDHFSLNSTSLIWTSVNVHNRQLFLAQSTDFQRKSTSLMQTIHCMCTVISLPFLFEPSVHSMSMFPDQHYFTPDRTNFRHQFQTILALNKLCRDHFLMK